MKMLSTIIVFTWFSFVSAIAQERCLDPIQLKSLDAKWEKALLESDVNQLELLLAEDFVWIHNHADATDTKKLLLKRASDPDIGATWNPDSRKSKDEKVTVIGSTGIVTGFTIVDRGSTSTTYHFMRTYIEIEGSCLLLANQTMVIPDKED